MVAFGENELGEEVRKKVLEKENEREEGRVDKENEETEDGKVVDPDAGWSEPISLDCCCVCHETGRTDCEWCLDCNVTRDRKKRLGQI